MNRSFVSALISLVCFASLPAIAQTPGVGGVQVRLLHGVNPTAGGVALTGTVQPVIQDGTMPSSHPVGTVTFFDGTTALNSSGVPLVAGSASSAATFVQVFGSPDAALTGWAAIPSGIFGDFNGDGTPDLFVYNTNTTVSQTIQGAGIRQHSGWQICCIAIANLDPSAGSGHSTIRQCTVRRCSGGARCQWGWSSGRSDGQRGALWQRGRDIQ